MGKSRSAVVGEGEIDQIGRSGCRRGGVGEIAGFDRIGGEEVGAVAGDNGCEIAVEYQRVVERNAGSGDFTELVGGVEGTGRVIVKGGLCQGKPAGERPDGESLVGGKGGVGDCDIADPRIAKVAFMEDATGGALAVVRIVAEEASFDPDYVGPGGPGGQAGLRR